MALIAHNHFLPALAMRHHRAEVAHRAADDEERRLLAEHLGGEVFQAIDRRVLAVLIVADLRLRHRPPHRRCWPRDRVAAQVHQSLCHVVAPPR